MDWPNVPDSWLDWLPEYDMPLGAPTGLAVKTGDVWSRSFASGTQVEFDGVLNNGTIRWAHGVVQSGPVRNSSSVELGCVWESIAPI